MPLVESEPIPPLENSLNLLLRSLAPRDARLLAPHLTRVRLRAGDIVADPGSILDRAIFPETAIISLRDGAGVGPETAMIGAEGMIGWSLLLGAQRTGLTAVVQLCAGSALAIRARPLREACGISATLQTSLLGFVEVLTRQLTGTISSMPDAIEKRLARWLLMVHDRYVEDALALTHDHIAAALYVRRASITDCLHLIEGEGVIRCTRGRIVIRDRNRLEALAGSAYDAIAPHRSQEEMRSASADILLPHLALPAP